MNIEREHAGEIKPEKLHLRLAFNKTPIRKLHHKILSLREKWINLSLREKWINLSFREKWI